MSQLRSAQTRFFPDVKQFAILDHTATSDLLIAYVPTAIMGAALEMYVAHQRGVPVVTISPLSVNWVVRTLSRRVFLDMRSFMRAVQSAGSPADLGDRGLLGPWQEALTTPARARSVGNR